MVCGYTWDALYLLPPPSKKVVTQRQVCILDKNHDGDHMSWSKITAPNTKEKS
jgi:hypothetical protein